MGMLDLEAWQSSAWQKLKWDACCFGATNFAAALAGIIATLWGTTHGQWESLSSWWMTPLCATMNSGHLPFE